MRNLVAFVSWPQKVVSSCRPFFVFSFHIMTLCFARARMTAWFCAGSDHLLHTQPSQEVRQSDCRTEMSFPLPARDRSCRAASPSLADHAISHKPSLCWPPRRVKSSHMANLTPFLCAERNATLDLCCRSALLCIRMLYFPGLTAPCKYVGN